MSAQLPKTVMALDYGDKRVGVAIASIIARIANPLTTLDNNEELLSNIDRLIIEYNVDLVVVGYPRGMDGQITAQTKIVDKFIERLTQSGLRVVTVDESLTSVQAEAELAQSKRPFEKGQVDALAATYILEDYLTSIKR